jgi:hypothetical protein
VVADVYEFEQVEIVAQIAVDAGLNDGNWAPCWSRCATAS